MPTVLPDKLGGGPKGLGDPDDRSLRRVEIDVMVPKIMRERARVEKCIEEVAAFTRCGKDNGLLIVVNCRKENTALKGCLTQWYQNEEFKNECTKMYLDDRSDYRRTGIKQKQKRMS